jgi:hypothetical protein
MDDRKFERDELVKGTRVVWDHDFLGTVIGTVRPAYCERWEVLVLFDDGGCHEVYIEQLRKPDLLDQLAAI